MDTTTHIPESVMFPCNIRPPNNPHDDSKSDKRVRVGVPLQPSVHRVTLPAAVVIKLNPSIKNASLHIRTNDHLGIFSASYEKSTCLRILHPLLGSTVSSASFPKNSRVAVPWIDNSILPKTSIFDDVQFHQCYRIINWPKV
jgi:hypothetical protein